MDTVSGIIAWESGEMDEDTELEFFQHLLDTRTLYHLQGCYQRRAVALLEAGLITEGGTNG